jgi:hypothetical protein
MTLIVHDAPVVGVAVVVMQDAESPCGVHRRNFLVEKKAFVPKPIHRYAGPSRRFNKRFYHSQTHACVVHAQYTGDDDESDPTG